MTDFCFGECKCLPAATGGCGKPRNAGGAGVLLDMLVADAGQMARATASSALRLCGRPHPGAALRQAAARGLMGRVLRERVRLVNVLAALSLTTDLATGFEYERGLRACLIADGLARALELGPADHRAAFLGSLLRGIGCGHASENAALFGDDMAFERFLVTFDPADEGVMGAQLAAFEAAVGGGAARRFAEVAPTVGPVAVRASCEVAVALGGRLRLPAVVLDAFGDVFERWDGRGLPVGRSGEDLHPTARVLSVADQAAIAHATGGAAAAQAEIARRAGGHLDPSVCQVFLDSAEEVLAPVEAAEDLVEAVCAAEPAPALSVPVDGLEGPCLALATFADLKGTHLIGHSTHVTALALEGARLAGLERLPEVRLAGLLHDIGPGGSFELDLGSHGPARRG